MPVEIPSVRAEGSNKRERKIMYYTAWYSCTGYQLSFAGVRNYSQNYWFVLTLDMGILRQVQ